MTRFIFDDNTTYMQDLSCRRICACMSAERKEAKSCHNGDEKEDLHVPHKGFELLQPLLLRLNRHEIPPFRIFTSTRVNYTNGPTPRFCRTNDYSLTSALKSRLAGSNHPGIHIRCCT